MAWQPTTILRVTRTFSTSTSPVLVNTDAGNGYLKALGNPEGPHALVCEYVCTQLAEWFGLPTFDYALLEVTDEDELRLSSGELASQGPAFITREEIGDSWSGDQRQLKLLSNPDEISRLVVFDTWTLNCDRYSIKEFGGKVNVRAKPQNVFLSTEGAEAGKLALRAMDHTHCISCGRELSKSAGDIDIIKDERVFGVFPEFREFLDRSLVKAAAEELRSVDASFVDEVLASVPREWSLDGEVAAAVRELLVGRAEFVADTIEGRLFPQQDLFAI